MAEPVEVEELLARLAEAHPEAAQHSSSISWHKKLKLGSPGKQVADEMECAMRLADDAKHQEVIQPALKPFPCLFPNFLALFGLIFGFNAAEQEFRELQAGICDLTALSSWVQHKAYSKANSEGEGGSSTGSEGF